MVITRPGFTKNNDLCNCLWSHAIDYWAMIESDWLPVDQSLVEKRPTRKLSPWDVATQRSANIMTLPSARSSYQSSLSTSWVCLVGCPRSLSKINQTNIATAAGRVASLIEENRMRLIEKLHIGVVKKCFVVFNFLLLPFFLVQSSCSNHE